MARLPYYGSNSYEYESSSDSELKGEIERLKLEVTQLKNEMTKFKEFMSVNASFTDFKRFKFNELEEQKQAEEIRRLNHERLSSLINPFFR